MGWCRPATGTNSTEHQGYKEDPRCPCHMHYTMSHHALASRKQRSSRMPGLRGSLGTLVPPEPQLRPKQLSWCPGGSCTAPELDIEPRRPRGLYTPPLYIIPWCIYILVYMHLGVYANMQIYISGGGGAGRGRADLGGGVYMPSAYYNGAALSRMT